METGVTLETIKKHLEHIRRRLEQIMELLPKATRIRSKRELQILELLYQHGKLDSKTLADMVGLNWSTIRFYISRLMKRGLISSFRDKSRKYYYLTEDGKKTLLLTKSILQLSKTSQDTF